MALPKFIFGIKQKIQFKRFKSGYWDGYRQGAKRCFTANGLFLAAKITDINIYCEFCKHPPRSREWTWKPWRAGFEYGYLEALSFYNSGDNPVSNDDSFYSQDIRIRMAFEKRKDNF